MKKLYYNTRYYAADFETTCFTGDKEGIKGFTSKIWSAGYTEIGKDKYNYSDCKLFTNIKDFINSLITLEDTRSTIVVYFHNLAFDGSFIISYLLKEGFKNNYDAKKLHAKEFNANIGYNGMFYQIKACFAGKTKPRVITFKDSLKILPFTLDKITKDLNVEHKKLVGSIDYSLHTDEDQELTDKEVKYISNDILGLAEALTYIEKDTVETFKICGKKYGLLEYLTIGSACLDFYKCKYCGGDTGFRRLFPELPPEIDNFIREAYRGGYCYAVEEYRDQVINLDTPDGVVLDYNSMYPSVLHSSNREETLNMLPYGWPLWIWDENSTDRENINYFIKNSRKYYYFVNLDCSFKLKEGMLPTIQIKESIYKDTEYLKDSETVTNITLTKEDFNLFFNHYDVTEVEIKKVIFFKQSTGLFDGYIDYWYDKKKEAKENNNVVLYLLSKLFLNNLYGKFGTNANANKKIAAINTINNSIEYLDYQKIIREQTGDLEFVSLKPTVYLPVAAAATSLARRELFNLADKLHERKLLLYCDTDSTHALSLPEDIKNSIHIDPLELQAWDLESTWDIARFVNAKRYVEFTKGKEPKANNIKCCGMPINCKTKLINRYNNNIFDITNNFTYGLEITGKLTRKRLKDGTVALLDTSFTMTE